MTAPAMAHHLWALLADMMADMITVQEITAGFVSNHSVFSKTDTANSLGGILLTALVIAHNFQHCFVIYLSLLFLM